ncbi:MAG TPA: hypothetical protein VH637_11015 [Streptosporangiaceae bacterium]|jgi:hypothetical protein
MAAQVSGLAVAVGEGTGEDAVTGLGAVGLATGVAGPAENVVLVGVAGPAALEVGAADGEAGPELAALTG